jgi:dephospho-CoA kinase
MGRRSAGSLGWLGAAGYRPDVVLIGLTGGIGSGKSTVSALLAERGALVIDADAITRELQQPGTEVFAAMRDRFGEGIVAEDGTLDRQAVADIVFTDAVALKDLGAIVHPAVGLEIAARLEAARDTDQVVVLDVPLLVESGRDDMAGIVVVDVDPEIAIERLVQQRGMREDDARARMANQATRADRLARADFVLDNSGTVGALRTQVDRLWSRLRALGADT